MTQRYSKKMVHAQIEIAESLHILSGAYIHSPGDSGTRYEFHFADGSMVFVIGAREAFNVVHSAIAGARAANLVSSGKLPVPSVLR